MQVNTKAYETGDIVWGQPLREGKRMPRRKGVVLGLFTESSPLYVIWWHSTGQRPQDDDSCTLLLAEELKPAGDVFELPLRTVSKMLRLADGHRRARSLTLLMASHLHRMKTPGAQHPVK